MRALGDESSRPVPSSYPSLATFAAQPARKALPSNRFASIAFGPSRRTRKRNGCRLLPEGARDAANMIVARSSSGIESIV